MDPSHSLDDPTATVDHIPPTETGSGVPGVLGQPCRRRDDRTDRCPDASRL